MIGAHCIYVIYYVYIITCLRPGEYYLLAVVNNGKICLGYPSVVPVSVVRLITVAMVCHVLWQTLKQGDWAGYKSVVVRSTGSPTTA
ncbi:hypothetical protein V1508DRAFT_418968 [Lipomyces doorenjongii]|uniref:uncharacterized protein n=1 Tax=Lipomyces doorenjongii TaxID=383834 RepID=UPI0034CD8053